MALQKSPPASGCSNHRFTVDFDCLPIDMKKSLVQFGNRLVYKSSEFSFYNNIW